MPLKESLKSRIMDKKDAEILMVLQENGRESLTNIAKKVNLSIDSVNNRIKALQTKGIFQPGIFIDPRAIGFHLIVDVKIKLQNITLEEKEQFISHLSHHPRIITLLSITGRFDFLCSIIAKDANELERVSTEIRNKYRKAITDWETTLILKTHKLEQYNVHM